ncbi:MAG: PocR ligand-binding domain-containing protein, partial [Peptostreptococcaceae bacterium]
MRYDLDKLSELLDNFTKATGIYIDAVSISGESLIHNRECEKSEFCKLIQSSEEGRKGCYKSYSKASKECIKWSDPYFFRCHAGLVMWSVPIIIDKKHVGSIVCGQVLLWKPDKIFYKELKQLNEDIVDFEELKSKVCDLNIISASKCKSIVSMLSIFVNYLIKTDNDFKNKEKKLHELRN